MNLNKMTIEDVQVSGKKVLVRCDFNVPLDAEGNITISIHASRVGGDSARRVLDDNQPKRARSRARRGKSKRRKKHLGGTP